MHVTPAPDSKRAFSLVELSIVLVILGLVAGGISAGKSLIRASELRAVMQEYQTFQTAARSFQGKHLFLPGDMPNATQFWGAEANCTTYTWDATPKALTCNGNGDGKVYHMNKGGTNASAVANLPEAAEMFRFWQHLANAGLIGGQYVGRTNGVDSAMPWVAVIGLNVPKSKVGNAGWTAYNGETQDVQFPTWFWPLELGNTFIFGTDTSNITDGPAITPSEAFNIDTKMDDGKPSYGRIISGKNQGFGTTCNTTNVATTANYRVTDNSIQCQLYFKM